MTLALVLDIGTSSVRCSLYTPDARLVPGTAARRPYAFAPDGSTDAVLLRALAEEAIDACLARYRALSKPGPIVVVGWTGFAMSWLGVDGTGRAVTPVFTYADAHSGPYADRLRTELEREGLLQRTYQQAGAPIHEAYAPAQLLRLATEEPALLEGVARWQTVSAHLLACWSGRAAAPISSSEAGWTGLLDRANLDWNRELLERLPISVDALPPIHDYAQGVSGLAPAYAARWPELAQTPFCLAVGDGAAANLGSGALDPAHPALTIGTSGALRVVVPRQAAAPPPETPAGLWCYPVDRRRWLIGGALTDGGSLYAWLLETLNYEDETRLLEEAASLPPDGHGLTVLPFLRSERSPGWATDARMTISGVSAGTRPPHLVRAALEAVALRFRLIAQRLQPHLPQDWEIMAGGGGLQENGLWRRILADALERPVLLTAEEEVTSRGAAILAFQALGGFPPPPQPAIVDRAEPDPGHGAIYAQAQARQERLYGLVIGRGGTG